MIDYNNTLNEFKKIRLCFSEKGVRQKAYTNSYSEAENQRNKLENINLYDVFIKYISKNQYYKTTKNNKTIKTNYLKECEWRAKNHQEKQIKEKGKDYKYKLKDGVIGVWSFNDYRYLSSECFESYRQWLGMQAFDGDFDVRHEGHEDALYTYDEAIKLANELRKRLYPKLCKYNWFCGIVPSTSGKGVHISTYSIPFDVELIKNNEGFFIYDTKLNENEFIQRRKNLFQANYIHKLKYIFEEMKNIWDELNIEQPIETFFDDAMYKPEQPWNITPLQDGNLMINPNFKCEHFDEIYDEIYSGINYDNINELVKKNLVKKLNKENDEQENLLIKKLKTGIKIKDKVYHIPDNNGFYFGHDKYHMQVINNETVKIPMISEVIHTLKCFYDDDEQIKIWRTKGFYCFDPDEKNVISWIINFKVKDKTGKEITQDEWSPNRYVINFLNTYCGFNIKYKVYTRDEIYEHCTVFNLKKNEYLSDFWNDILIMINNENGIYMVISPTGSGKTKTHTDINNKVRENIFNNLVFNQFVEKPVLCTEPYNSILESKFNKGNTEIITGSKHFDKGLDKGTLYVTNYIHFVSDIDIEDAKQFKYIIIDESHLITKEEFRSGQLVDFAKKLIELSKYCIIILQTATPMDESKIFGNLVKRYVKLVKQDKRHIKYKYLNYSGTDKFSLDYIYGLVRNNINKGIKTYVYQPNISLDKAKAFANLFKDIDVCIYHKRLKERCKNKSENSSEYQEYVKYGMPQLENYHRLDNYMLLISSVYFGVGNDIDDEIDNACCIILGNRTWQEDVQVFGRWRNAKNINVYEIIGNLQNGELDDNMLNYNEMLRYKTKNIKYNFNDITNKKNSIVVRGNVYEMKDIEDTPLWACISICEQFHSNKNEKDKHLPEYVDEYDENIEELEYSLETVEESKKFFKSLSNERLNIKKDIINKIMTGNEKEIKYNNIPKLDKWTRIIKRLYYNIGKDEFENLLNHICGYKLMHSLDVFNDLLDNYLNDKLDYAEIAAFEYYRKNEDIRQAFMLWYFCQDINEPDYKIMSNWYFKFKWKAKCYKGIPGCLIEYLFSDVKIRLKRRQIQALKTTGEFLNVSLQDEIDKISSSIFEYEPTGRIKKFKQTNKTIQEINDMIDKFEGDNTDDKLNGKKGGKKGSPKKSIIITGKIRESRIDLLKKHNLQIGQVFTSCTELASYIGKSNETISAWMKKGWISCYV